MELIEAFEELSLHVRSSQQHYKQKIVLNNSEEPSLASSSSGPINWQQHVPNQYSSYQLHLFDDSIETLFTQINELDQSNQNETDAYHMREPKTATGYKHYPLRRTFLDETGGSLGTSQEDDSDNSSQKSNNGFEQSRRFGRPSHPLVVDLMKRDIGAITDSVRRICRILALGSEIKSIYETHFLGNTKTQSSASTVQRFDPQTCRALCESFFSLCSSEPNVCDLPTFRRFTELCHILMQKTNREIEAAKLIFTKSISTCKSVDCQEGKQDNEDFMCLNDARDELDCALLECDQNRPCNWTENKLYVDSGNR